MDFDWNFVSSFFISLVLHAVFAGFLVFSIDTPVRRVVEAPPQVNIVEAISVDSREVEKELQRLKDIEKEKIAKQEKQQKELEEKLRQIQEKTNRAEENRRAEEQRLAELRKKKAAEEKARKAEEERLSRLKKQQEELEKKRREAEEKKRREEAERKKQEEERLRREEEERKRKAEEQRLQEALAEEQRQQEAAQRSRDQRLLQNIVVSIKRQVAGNFNKSGMPPGLECVLSVRLVPGGEVVSVTVSKPSGNDIFDRRALVAVQKASPLPVPEDLATFERLRLRQFAFRFRPE